MVVALDLSNNQVFISHYRSLFHKRSTNKEFLARLEDLFHYAYYVKSGIKMHF